MALISGADGPMVLFSSLILAKDLFVPITVVGYLYLGLTYGGYPYLIKLLIPERLRGIPRSMEDVKKITSARSRVRCRRLHSSFLLFPVAAAVPVAICRRGGTRGRSRQFLNLLGETFLYGAVLPWSDLGDLCEANTILSPVVPLAVAARHPRTDDRRDRRHHRRLRPLFLDRRQIQSDDRIAGVSCVLTTAKIVRKIATRPIRAS